MTKLSPAGREINETQSTVANPIMKRKDKQGLTTKPFKNALNGLTINGVKVKYREAKVNATKRQQEIKK